MAFKTQDGMRSYGSKFRASRYNRENSNPSQGSRSESHELEGKGSSDSAPAGPSHKPSASADTQEPGPEQKKVRELHMSFGDDGSAHVHTVHADGSEEHTDHMSHDEAMVHAGKKAIGAWPPGQREYPDDEHTTPHSEPDADDFAPEVV